MKLNWICYLVAILIFSTSAAQDQKVKFNSINTGGIILGQNKSYAMFQSVNGLLYQKWFAGIGAGYDYYYYRSVPVFIDARRYLGKDNKGFLYGDAGYNFPGENTPGREVLFHHTASFKGGIYGDIGVGYGIKFTKGTCVLFSGGLSYKNIHLRTATFNPCITSPCPENINHYNYDFSRVLLKAGLRF